MLASNATRGFSEKSAPEKISPFAFAKSDSAHVCGCAVVRRALAPSGKMKWRTLASRARNVFGAYAGAEGCSFGAHQYKVYEMNHAPRRTMEEGFDYDGHFSWFARELAHEPNPKRLFEDAFNASPIATIPRTNALHMLQFYLTARERDQFPNHVYPAEVTKTANALLRRLEKTHGLEFKVDHDSVTNGTRNDDANADVSPVARTLRNAPVTRTLRKALSAVTHKIPQRNQAANSKEVGHSDSAVRGFLVDGIGGSQGGVETHTELRNSAPVDFIRTNKFEMNPYYKPIAFQLLIAAFRFSAETRLKRNGFEKKKDGATNMVCWVRPPKALKPVGKTPTYVGNQQTTTKGFVGSNPRETRTQKPSTRYDPVVFLHGLGIGVAPYAEYVCSLPTDRPVVVPEWPNISYSWDARGHQYPSPSEIANFLERVTQTAAMETLGRDLRDEKIDASAPSIAAATKNTKCDVIAHSYGTVCLTHFRARFPGSVRRCVYIDPVCFLPSFGSYLRYGFDDHLGTWCEMRQHWRARSVDPNEPMSFTNLVLASWFVKGDASTQQLMKRLLFPHEAWERKALTERDMVVLSGLDEIVGSDAIHKRFKQT
jgi:pimeloyl-ACP methyl ester carboxylesterase